jgi:FMN phosphatase YigB (HAD superfamily)
MRAVEKWLHAHQDYTTYSFDVFDTLLRRRVDPPEEIKRLVAQHISERLAGSGIHRNAEGVLAERSKVEDRLRQDATSKGTDASASLDDIMADTLKSIGAAGVLNWPDIVNYELALEKTATEPMPGVRDVLTYLRSVQKRIVAVSETYLSLSQVASILEHHDLLRYVDRLYISCDLGKSKATGNLYRYLLESEEGKVVHIGDKYRLDCQIPLRLKMKALWFHSRDESRRREELRKLSAGENKLAYVNTIIRQPDKAGSALYSFGYDVLGPALTLFVHNVAESAREEGIRKLFFMARDGFAMKKIYDILQTTVCTQPDFPTGTYMCLGRIPVRLASVDHFTYAHISDAYPYIARFRGNDVSFGDILRSYGIEPAHFTRIARQCGVEMDKPIGPLTQEPRLLALLESADFQETLRAKSDALRLLLRRYLDGIGFMGDKKVAVVDANAEGLTQSLLDRAFTNDRDYPAVIRYYFNALKLDHDGGSINLDLPQVRGIFSDWRKDSQTDQRLFFIFGMLIELFAHPNHGVTIGYRDVNGRVLPVFKRTPQESQYEMTSQALKGMLSYARDYGTGYSLHNYTCEELLVQARSNVTKWVRSPPKRYVAGLVNLFTTSDWPLESNQRLIEQLSMWDLLTTRGLGRKQNKPLWLEGTRALAPVPGLNSLYHTAAACRNHCLQLVSWRKASRP